MLTNALTAKAIARLKEGKHRDGQGLQFEVKAGQDNPRLLGQRLRHPRTKPNAVSSLRSASVSVSGSMRRPAMAILRHRRQLQEPAESYKVPIAGVNRNAR
ncbi:MAG: hypothetical protein U1E70_01195 [Acetobacteraceae bacterium]